jgi:pyrroloquinoline quinone biosynthesis protein B
MQSSVAIRGGGGPWFLVNASPDLRQQLEMLTPRPVDAVRASPIAGVLVTDSEIDHTAGLLLMRESAAPLRVYGEAAVEAALADTLLRMLDRFCGVDWQRLDPGRPTALAAALSVELVQPGVFVFRDGGRVVTYAPAVAALDEAMLTQLAASDLVLVDGTFWRDDELAHLGISARRAQDMGHVALSGPDGTLAALARLERPRKVLVHINNTNPILLEDSPERAEVERAGVEVAYDGFEVEL